MDVGIATLIVGLTSSSLYVIGSLLKAKRENKSYKLSVKVAEFNQQNAVSTMHSELIATLQAELERRDTVIAELKSEIEALKKSNAPKPRAKKEVK